MTYEEASHLLRLRRLEIKAEDHLKAALASGNRSLARHAAVAITWLNTATTEIAFANLKPYSDFD